MSGGCDGLIVHVLPDVGHAAWDLGACWLLCTIWMGIWGRRTADRAQMGEMG